MFSGFYYPRNLLIIKSKKIANYLEIQIKCALIVPDRKRVDLVQM